MTDRNRRFGLRIQPWRNARYISIERDVVGMTAGEANLRRPSRPPGRDRAQVAPYLQLQGARRPDLPPQRRARPPFAPDQARQIVEAVATTEPVDHGLPGHGGTLKKLRQWVLSTFGRRGA